MAKKKADGAERGAKSNAIREYLSAHKNAKPKEVVEALKSQGLEVSPNMVSILRAKAKIKKAKAKAGEVPSMNGPAINKARGLESVLTLYRAAKGQQVPNKQVSGAFMSLVEMMS